MINDINVNNVAYDWNDIDIHFVGLDIDPIGVSNINYSTTDNDQYVYSRQGMAVGRQYGQNISRGSITIDYYEMHKLRKWTTASKSVPFDVKITYKATNILLSDKGGAVIYNNEYSNTFIDTLYGCRLSFDGGLNANQGEMNLTVTYELNPVWINYGGKLSI